MFIAQAIFLLVHGYWQTKSEMQLITLPVPRLPLVWVNMQHLGETYGVGEPVGGIHLLFKKPHDVLFVRESVRRGRGEFERARR